MPWSNCVCVCERITLNLKLKSTYQSYVINVFRSFSPGKLIMFAVL